MPASDIEVSELESIAYDLADNGFRWHFHIASAGCRIAEGRSGIVFVLEDYANGKTYRAPATNADLAIGERLAKRLHGSEIFDDDAGARMEDVSSDMAALAEEARVLSKDNQPWHHHMLFPNCAFNSNPGLWTLQLEGSGSLHAATSRTEPKAALSIIEKLFYDQKTID